jgi:hypothetical protein
VTPRSVVQHKTVYTTQSIIHHDALHCSQQQVSDAHKSHGDPKRHDTTLVDKGFAKDKVHNSTTHVHSAVVWADKQCCCTSQCLRNHSREHSQLMGMMPGFMHYMKLELSELPTLSTQLYFSRHNPFWQKFTCCHCKHRLTSRGHQTVHVLCSTRCVTDQFVKWSKNNTRHPSTLP